MIYPIDAEEYIAAMEAEFGPNKAAEAAHRAFIPLVNAAYQDGLDRKSGYPLCAKEEIRAFEQCLGRATSAVGLITAAIDWCNRAYDQGRRDAEEGARA